MSMHPMKWILMTCLALSLAACGGQQTRAEGEPETAEEGEERSPLREKLDAFDKGAHEFTDATREAAIRLGRGVSGAAEGVKEAYTEEVPEEEGDAVGDRTVRAFKKGYKGFEAGTEAPVDGAEVKGEPTEEPAKEENPQPER